MSETHVSVHNLCKIAVQSENVLTKLLSQPNTIADCCFHLFHNLKFVEQRNAQPKNITSGSDI